MFKKIVLVFILIVLAYSFFVEPNKLNVVKYTINNKALKGIRVVLLGDFHVRPGDYAKLRNLVKTINEQEADIILSVGDYLNGNSEKSTMPIKKIAERLTLINARRNFYSVLGEHDVKANKEDVIKTLRSHSISVIENTNRRVSVKGRTFYIAGVEDMTSGKPDLVKALRGTRAPVILISHSPDIFPQVPVSVALTLAGHTHGGQIHIPPFRPLILKSQYSDRFVYGLIQEEGKKMIVTRGIGTSDVPARLNCPPEIVVIDFI